MNCEQAQEMILTDYLDGRLTGSVKAQCEAHLEKCPSCQAFLSVASETLVAPFVELPKERMPEPVASVIMQRVRRSEYQREHTWGQEFLEGIRGWHVPVLPVVGWVATGLICFMIAGVGLNMNGSEQAKQTERVLFLAEVAESSQAKSGAAGEYGTSMETYFLEDKEAS